MVTANKLIAAAKACSDALQSCPYDDGVATIYNPWSYAWKMHERYCRTYGTSRKKVIFLGMNPGPYGMVQTGIPFGEVAAVRDWLGLAAQIDQPENEHAKRPIQGLACQRSEVSGRRLWGLFAERFPSAPAFFQEHFILNYCPLAFLGPTGRNITPDKLAVTTRAFLQEHCDRHLQLALQALQPEWCIGVGAYAEKCLQRVAPPNCQVGRILHPSPASPAANKGWGKAATKQLVELGVWA
jgi:single-strand selective monofunctional uracil DNA glycosylase